VVGPNQDQTIQFLAFSLCLNFGPKFQLILHQMYIGQRAGHKAMLFGFAIDLAHRHTQFCCTWYVYFYIYIHLYLDQFYLPVGRSLPLYAKPKPCCTRAPLSIVETPDDENELLNSKQMTPAEKVLALLFTLANSTAG
jgi:hypothetical protein